MLPSPSSSNYSRSVSGVSAVSSHTVVSLPSSPTLSNTAVSSNTTRTSAPSTDALAAIISKWGIGWQTPTLMLGAYVLSVIIAVGHLLLFHYLNGREADGPRRVVPQTYVSTTSNILANMFGYSLRGGLALAFVQHLWYLLRVETMKVSTIELLFQIRANPFILLRPAALRATPLLFVLALILWALQVVVSFPPGAITVITTQKTSFQVIPVPTFNASFMGNGSGVEANAYSLNTLEPDPPFGFTTNGANGRKNSNLIPRLASQILVSGEALAIPSPCGMNCSYIVQFEGPYFSCNSSRANLTYSNIPSKFHIFNSSYFSPRSSLEIRSRNNGTSYNGTATKARFEGSIFTPLEADADAFFAYRDLTGPVPQAVFNGTAIMQQDNITCIPSRATFTINHTYINSIHTKIVAVTPIDLLTNLAPLTKDSAAIVPGFCGNGPPNSQPGVRGSPYGTGPANWTETSLAYFRDNNFMAIFDTLMKPLVGTYLAGMETPPLLNLETPDRSTTYTNLVWDVYGEDTGPFGSPTRNGSTSIIDNTRLNTAYGKLSKLNSIPPAFNITQEILNDYLLNMTTSVMVSLRNWNTTSNATITSVVNVYSFSKPLSLILPYFVSLGIALPFILLGCISLWKNGVSAMDGSFEQIITTSTGSSILDQAAAGGCLGGGEGIPRELKNLEVRFGEFIGQQAPGKVKRAGFGVDSEVVPLRKGDMYGILRKI